MITATRIYDEPKPGCTRVLVDRLWPRGISKKRAALKAWAKDLAPSAKLRRWYHQHGESWGEFKRRYFHELRDKENQLAQLRRLAREQCVSLVFAAKNVEKNNAVALRDILTARKSRRRTVLERE